MEDFDFLKHIIQTLKNYRDKTAFFINNTDYTFGELSGLIAEVQSLLSRIELQEDYIGVYLNDDIYTYASIVALWFSGYAFIPVNPQFPAERNRRIIEQLNLKVILHSKKIDKDLIVSGCSTVYTGALSAPADNKPELTNFNRDKDAYVLFTCGFQPAI